MEKVDIKSLRGQAKVVGIVISVSGAMVMTLYQGPVIKILNSNLNAHNAKANSWMLGSILLIGGVILWSFWIVFQVIYHDQICQFYDIRFLAVFNANRQLIFDTCVLIQAPVLKKYPAELSFTTIMCLFGALQSAVVALIFEHKTSSVWAIGWNIDLLSVVYSVQFLSNILLIIDRIIETRFEY